MTGYVEWIRKRVGHDKIFLNYAVAIIANRQGEILIHRRDDFKNGWSLPGGAIELGESAEEAVKREVKEETGLTVKIKKLIGIYSGGKYAFIYPHNRDRVQPIAVTFLCRVTTGKLRLDHKETLEFKYVPPEKMPRLSFEQNMAAVRDYAAGRFGVVR